MDKYGVVFNLLLFVLILHLVTAQRCYQCISSDVVGCGDPFTLTSSESVQIEDCLNGECFFRRETENGVSVYTRGCSLGGQPEGCYTVSRGEECFCSGNLCNAAPVRFNLISTAFMVSLILLLYFIV